MLSLIPLDPGLFPCFEESLDAFVLEVLDHDAKRNLLRYA
jgi:hypothetical protein